jgi:hypothetical protein
LIPVTVGDLNGEQHEFPFHMTAQPGVSVPQPNSSLMTAAGTFEVRRIPFRFEDATDVDFEVLAGELNVARPGDTSGETVPFADSDP